MFVNESGVNLAMMRRYGPSRGRRISGTVPGDPGINVTLVGALSPTGFKALMTIPGATTDEVFRLCRAGLGADVETGRCGGDG